MTAFEDLRMFLPFCRSDISDGKDEMTQNPPDERQISFLRRQPIGLSVNRLITHTKKKKSRAPHSFSRLNRTKSPQLLTEMKMPPNATITTHFAIE
jgi:hypothetical protein